MFKLFWSDSSILPTINFRTYYNENIIQYNMNPTKIVQKTYNNIAPDYAEEFTTPSRHLDEFLTFLPPQGNVLDLGCGPGVDACYMLKKGYKVVAVDYSEYMLQIAQKRCTGVQWQNTDINLLDFPKTSFDGIVASFSLIHITKSKLPDILQKITQWLKTNGYLYLAMQAGTSQEVLIPDPLAPRLKMFLNIVSKKEITELLKSTGFDISKMYTHRATGYEFDFDKIYIIAKNSTSA